MKNKNKKNAKDNIITFDVNDEVTRKVLGCHLVGPNSSELIQLVAVAIKMGARKEDFDKTCAVHPTAAEELVTLN